ncbi:MAG: sugar ABC transporter substrate-binding protein [Clostridiales bacterium]|nr:sugar ABC transporter substrate-binding protein [Clostridiales bacterium]
MKKYSRLFAIVLAVVFALSMAACGGGDEPAAPPEPETAPVTEPAPAPEPEPEAEPAAGGVNEFGIPYPNEDYRIVMTYFNGENPVAREIESGFLAAAETVGLELWVMDNKLDPVVINANADMAIAAGDVDYYVLYTNQIESNPAVMDKLVPAGIPVYTIGTDAIASDGTTAPVFFSATDNVDSAFLAAESLAKAAQAKGWTEDEILFVSMGFLEAGGVFVLRTEGALAGMQSVFPNISEENGNYIETSSTGDAQVAHQRFTDILTTLPPDKKVLCWTHSDDVTGQLLAALQTAGRGDDGLLVSNGLSMQMIDMLRDPSGIVIGSIDLNFGKWGFFMLKQIIEELNDGTPIPPINNAPYQIITPDNVDEIYPKE